MHIVHKLEDIPELSKPLALSIGSFDGVHLGHQYLLNTMRGLASSKGHIAIVTFSNHPSQVIKTKTPSSMLCSQEHKLLLLQKNHVDLVILLPFTEQMANLTYAEFLQSIKEHYAFSHLVLGQGAAFGKGLEGNEQKIKSLSEKMNFTPHYLKKEQVSGHVVSSGRIRSLVQQGDLTAASELLGRPYSLYGHLQKVATTNHLVMDLNGICLPPEGTYAVTIKEEKALCEVKANPPCLQIQAPYLQGGAYEVVLGPNR
jgi:riboflavin kinase/FMN adenylyltransferase